ncbi:hypothetical protein FQN57_004893 [Myotisia sp. PD_48]|nr:hypothetical protein FQN57_004893 [Myotisia sp. PD_48]
MTKLANRPRTPAAWREYATEEALVRIPLSSFIEDGENYMQRRIYIDTFEADKGEQVAISDVIAFKKPEVTFKIPKNGILQIYARVLTSDSPTHLSFVSDPPGSAGAVAIYASVLDQPMTFSYPGSDQKHSLELGEKFPHVGVIISFKGPAEVKYTKQYPDLLELPTQFGALLETQLRIALIQFWRREDVAVSLCSFVAIATVATHAKALLNRQAVALKQQLLAQSIAGSESSYFPPLTIDSYLGSTEAALKAAFDFQHQYDRYADNKSRIEELKLAWKAMLDQTTSTASMRKQQRNIALEKYKESSDVVMRALGQFDDDKRILELAKVDFENGVREWKKQKQLEAIFQIFMVVLDFSLEIGLMFVGMGGAEAPEKAAKGVKLAGEATKLAGHQFLKLNSETLEKLLECALIVQQIYPDIKEAVDELKGLEDDPDMEISSTPGVAGDAVSAESIAAWDTWLLETEDQLQFAISEEIPGAQEYQLALKKHAINGKLLAQTQAAAIKAGQEFIQTQLENALAYKNIKTLQELLKKFTGKEKEIDEAQVHLYDRLLACRTWVVIEMQNVTWAYKYFALADSSVQLDSQKRLEEFSSDIFTIKREIQVAEEKYDRVYEEYHFKFPPRKLPLDYSSRLVSDLKKGSKATFTLVPSPQSLAGPFINASHFRVLELQIYLNGARPKGRDSVDLRIRITTSGTFSDIEGKKCFHFTGNPRAVVFGYELLPDGKTGDITVSGTFDSEHHAEPTPFTQWSIEVQNKDKVDLGSLTDVELRWGGKGQF